MNQRVIFLHHHLFKNSGTSFDYALSRVFGDKKKFLAHIDDKKMIEGGQFYLEAFLRENKILKALSSHEVRFKACSSSEFIYLPFTFIRCPILRSYSVYNFERAQKDVVTHGSMKAKEVKNFSEFVKWYLNDAPYKTITNFQVRKCSLLKLEHRSLDKGWVLDEAKSNLLNYFNFGVVERYSESIAQFNQILQPELMQHPLPFTWLNKTQAEDAGSVSLDEQRERVLEKMGPIRDQFLSENSEDIQLYEFSVDLFEANLTSKRHPNIGCKSKAL